MLGGVDVPRIENNLPLGGAEMHIPFLADALFRFHEAVRSTWPLQDLVFDDKRNPLLWKRYTANCRRLGIRRLQYFFLELR